MMEQYIYRKEIGKNKYPLQCNILTFGGYDDVTLSERHIIEWKDLIDTTVYKFEHQMYNAGHIFWRDKQDVIHFIKLIRDNTWIHTGNSLVSIEDSYINEYDNELEEERDNLSNDASISISQDDLSSITRNESLSIIRTESAISADETKYMDTL
jgi:hypothetical protein